MRCYCCDKETPIGRKVKLRVMRGYDLACGGPDSAAYLSYLEEMTFRWSVVCLACYLNLDNNCGAAEINGRVIGLAGHSRRYKASVIDEVKYRLFRRREAQKLGLELDDEL